MNNNKAYWNSSKLCWEVWLEEPQGDRYVKVFKHANVAHQILRDQGIKFVEAYIDVISKRPLLLIADPNYWLDNEDDIVRWAMESNIKYFLEGMILSFDTNEDKMMFMLRWQ